MDGVLIAAQGKRSVETLSELLRGCCPAAELLVAGSGAAARQLLDQRLLDLMVVSAPLPDESGVELAVDAVRRDVGVLLLTNAEYAEDLASRVGEQGVFVLEKPFSKVIFVRALRLIEVSVGRIRELRRQHALVQSKVEEQRLVGRAKCLLVQYKSFTEKEAHCYVEKQAMDRRMTKGQIAEEILRTFETSSLI